MTGARRFTVSTPDWGQAHLSLDAIVAYVDDELAPGARARAETHLGSCADCRAEVVAQRQARTALRAAGGPELPSSLLRTLRAIPVDAELPPMPPGLAVTTDGQFVLLRDVPEAAGHDPTRCVAGGCAPSDPAASGGRPHPAGTCGLPPAGWASGPATAPRRLSRRARFGAVSGLAVGALAVGALAAPSTPAERGVLGGTVLNVPVQARLSTIPSGSAVPAAEPAVAPTDAASPVPAGPAVIDARLRARLDRMAVGFRLDGGP